MEFGNNLIVVKNNTLIKQSIERNNISKKGIQSAWTIGKRKIKHVLNDYLSSIEVSMR